MRRRMTYRDELGDWRRLREELVMPGFSRTFNVFLISGCWVQKSSDQVLLGDDFAEPRIVRDEFLNEFVHAVLEDIVHVAVLEPVADTAGVALRGALAAIGDADLVEVAHEVAVTTGERARQRVVEDQQVRDQPRLQ